MKNTDLVAAAVAVIFLASTFGLALHFRMAPPEREVTLRVFESYAKNGLTTIYPYGHEVITFKGEYNFTEGATYHIKYLDTPPHHRLISFEEVG